MCEKTYMHMCTCMHPGPDKRRFTAVWRRIRSFVNNNLRINPVFLELTAVNLLLLHPVYQTGNITVRIFKEIVFLLRSPALKSYLNSVFLSCASVRKDSVRTHERDPLICYIYETRLCAKIFSVIGWSCGLNCIPHPPNFRFWSPNP